MHTHILLHNPQTYLMTVRLAVGQHGTVSAERHPASITPEVDAGGVGRAGVAGGCGAASFVQVE